MLAPGRPLPQAHPDAPSLDRPPLIMPIVSTISNAVQAIRNATVWLLMGRSKRFLNIVGLILIAAIAWLDHATGPEIVLSIFYLIPVVIVTWYAGGRSGVMLAVVSAIAMLLVDIQTQNYVSLIIPQWNAAVRLGFLLIITYILCRRKAAEEKARHLMNVRSEFTAMVSHELRTPIAAIKEGLSLVGDEAVGPLNTRQQQYLAIVRRNVDRLARLVSDVLSFQKLELGRMEYHFEACDMNTLVTSVVTTFAPVAAKQGIELRADVMANLPTVHCDPDKISQVVSNLVDNAIKFSERGCVCVATDQNADMVSIRVSDQGVGIRSEDVPRLFQGFTRLEYEEDRKTSGTGLGLAIAKRIIDQHRGRIEVDSVRMRGTTFVVSLPIQPGHTAERNWT